MDDSGRNWLRRVRKTAGLRQHQVAAEAGISRPTYSRIEGGDPVRPKKAKAIARVLGFDWTQFYDDSETEPSQVQEMEV